MSGSYANTDGETERLNAAAAHDTGLYDPAVHDNQIVALYNTDAQAHAAQEALVAAGVPAGTIHVVDRGAGSTVEGTGGSSAEQGFWSAIKSLFVPDEDLGAYNHALQRGHAVLVVTPDASTDRHRLIQVLEGTDPVDFDAKLEEWRQSGYDHTGAPRAAGTSSAIGAAAGMAGATGAEYAGGSAPRVGAAVENSVPDATAGQSAMADASVPETVPASTAAMGSGMDTGLNSPGATDVAASTGHQASTAATGGPDTIKVAEERLRVGKREVAQGAVRVRSYVVERPVEEQVRLREERIHVERRPVDREATPGDMNPFQARTIEARATSEEPVVSKTARVVEEIGLHKEAAERTETVRDTVRRTEVDVEDASEDAATKGGTLGTGGTMPNATPDAGTSGANSPRK